MAIQSPLSSQRIARWFSFFAEYSFEVKYNPEKQYALAYVLLPSPRCELAHVTTFSSSIMDIIRVAYTTNIQCIYFLCALDSEEL